MASTSRSSHPGREPAHLLHTFARRAAHVDVADLRAALYVVDRRLGHPICACKRRQSAYGNGARFLKGWARREVLRLFHKPLREVTISFELYSLRPSACAE